MYIIESLIIANIIRASINSFDLNQFDKLKILNKHIGLIEHLQISDIKITNNKDYNDLLDYLYEIRDDINITTQIKKNIKEYVENGWFLEDYLNNSDSENTDIAKDLQ